MEIEYLHITDTAAEHLIADGVSIHDGTVYGYIRLIAVRLLYAQAHTLAEVGLYEAAGVADGHIRYVRVVDGYDNIADREPGRLRGRIGINACYLQAARICVLINLHA